MVEATEQAAVPTPEPPNTDTSLARATRILALGNIVSKLLGLVRQMTITRVFGADLTSVYQLAVLVPMTLFEMIRGGMVESALVPTFNELAESEDRDVLWSAVSAFLSVALVALFVLVVLAELLYRPIGFAIGVSDMQNVALQPKTLNLMRIAFPVVLFLSTSSIFTSLLYALKRFTIPAFLPAVFNGTIVIAAWAWREDVSILIFGMLLGSVLQIAVQAPFLRDMRLRWHFDLKHPAVRKIIRLFTPVLAVLLLNMGVMMLSYKIANLSPAGDGAVSYMVNATTLYQFPFGLIVTAISAAILPTLAEKAREGDDAFKATLANGLRLVLALIVPAAVGLFVLAHPIIDLVFGNEKFIAKDVTITAQALRLYAVGLPFAGIDLMLVYAAYARGDTRRPAIIGMVSLVVYTIFMLVLFFPLGFFTLMVADMIKHVTHTVLMLVLLRREAGSLRGYQVGVLAGRVLVAAVIMGAAAWYASTLLTGRVAGNLGEILTVGISGLVGVGVYAVFVFLFDLREVKALLLRR